MKTTDRIYLIGGPPRTWPRKQDGISSLHSTSDMQRVLSQPISASSVWIASKAQATDMLIREALKAPTRTNGKHRLGRLLLLFPPRPTCLPALEELFDPVAWGAKSFVLLPINELAEVLASENRHDLFIGGFVDEETESVILYRGDFERLPVPLSLFSQSIAASAPLDALAITDFGQTVCFGSYQAASDAILYETDPAFRRRIKSQRLEADRSFGASLRRLRHIKGLRQEDFGNIPAKTIARIERGETEKPRPATLQKISQVLHVRAEEIESY